MDKEIKQETATALLSKPKHVAGVVQGSGESIPADDTVKLEDLLTGEEIDALLKWPKGRAERNARLGHIPFFFLPDRVTIRFRKVDVERRISLLRKFHPLAAARLEK
jgi:hypothetical protein